MNLASIHRELSSAVESQSTWEPEHRLLTAILQRALGDAWRELKNGQVFSVRGRATRAREWFRSDSRAPFSYLWICEHLGIEDTEKLRQTIRARNVSEIEGIIKDRLMTDAYYAKIDSGRN